MSDLLKVVEEKFAGAKASFPEFGPGDTVNVHVRIKEGDKERIQQYQGVVLQRKGSGGNGESFTVRKVVGTFSVERIFPLLSPNIEKVEVLRRGKVRRAKLYYLRDAKGKRARIKEAKRSTTK